MVFSSFFKILVMVTFLVVQVNAEPSQQTRNLRIQDDDIPQEQARRLSGYLQALIINLKNNPGVRDGVINLLKKVDYASGTSKKIKEKAKGVKDKVKDTVKESVEKVKKVKVSDE